MKRLFHILQLMLIAVYPLSAQKTVIDQITYTYVMSDVETVRDAKVEALRQAQIRLIADNFGTTVNSATTITFSSENGNDSVRDFTIGETEVKGEWIRTIGTPMFQKSCVDDHFIITVTVKGEMREIVSNAVNCRIKVLRNGTDDRYESTTFRNRDYMYLSFQTPEDGYLAVYLTDGETVQCLFPYSGLPASTMNVLADRKYILFSKEESGDLDPVRVRRMQLGCSGPVEHNRLYVIFSPNRFSKAIDQENGNMPRSLSYNDFLSWLTSVRKNDTRMSVSPFDITISK